MNITKKRLIAKLIVFIRAFLKRIEGHAECYDVPDPRDFQATEMLKAPRVALKKYINLFTEFSQETMNQGQEPSCTAFATTILKRIADTEEHSKLIKHDAWQQWGLQGKPAGGDYLNRALKILVQNGLITEGFLYKATGYSQVRKPNQNTGADILRMKKWLARKNPIMTGINIRRETKQSGSADNMYWAGKSGIIKLDTGEAKTGGHAIALLGYDDEGKEFGVPGWIAWTSWGEWGVKKNGTFLIPYDQTQYLYSCYILHDAKDIK